MQDLETIAYPANAPITSRPDWRPPSGKAAVSLDRLRSEALDPFGTRIAICNCLYGVQALFSEDMAAAFARAVNQWMATEWLDREPRLRASIVLPMQSVERAVDEIEHWAADRRFVQAMVLASGDSPLGSGSTGRSTRRRFATICRSASMPAAPITIRTPRRAGARPSPRTMSARSRHSNRN
jgi:predicted TIM-barrel fold metal-dependent hydrolase